LKFSDQIFEAIIKDPDYNRGVCTLSPVDPDTASDINEVPLPHLAGNGNAGIFCGFKEGSRVVAMFTSARSRDVTVIVGLLPKPNLLSSVFGRRKPLDTPSGTVAYPEIQSGDLVLRGDNNAEIKLSCDGDVLLKTVNGGGAYLQKNQNRASFVVASEDIINYSNGFKVISGSVRRMSGTKANMMPRPDLTQTPLFVDPSYAKRTLPFGFFRKSRPLRRSYPDMLRKRNPEISEYRMVINEFSTDYMFTGFDDEVSRSSNSLGMYDNSETFVRNRQQGNTLHMAEHELIEVIGGNVVDINGNILDINYREISYGDNDNRVPAGDPNIGFDRARRISRRGIGYHFQLSTNTRTSDPSESQSNFVFDIDKEGILKVNVPASSDTGNIPFVSNANYTGPGDSVEVSFKNPSTIEPIPVPLRDENGEMVFPDKNSQGITHRNTGVRYSVEGESPYFPVAEGATEVRVNTTQHHNMYAVAERLIANTVRIVNIPPRYTDDNGFPEGTPIGKPFEIPIPDSLNAAESDDLAALREILGQGETDFPTFMGVVAVDPGPPAIYHGGGDSGNGVGTVIAGKLYIDETKNPPYSNAFKSSLSGDEVSAEISDGEEPAKPVGGKSANLNFEGSIETSVGVDNYDGKSIVLDTAGSIISWMGKDLNGRSMIMQTDGDMLINVGGTYDTVSLPGAVVTRQMNKGRFELRVNVVDKGHVDTDLTSTEREKGQGGNPGADSDYIISISEAGLVIAGMKTEAPMIFRNDGPILIESASGPVTLKGMEVRTVGPKGAINVIKPPTRNS